MAPENQAEEANSNNSSAGEESGQEQQGQQQDPTAGEAGNGGQQQAPAADKDTKLPDDHPIVKALAKSNEKLTKATSELAEAQANSAKASKLEQELAERPSKEALETLQNRYDRLEAFLVAAGGPLGRALDSRTFTKELFESDKDITDLVKDWHKANPTATAAALQSTAPGGESSGKHNPNDLLRIAAGKK